MLDLFSVNGEDVKLNGTLRDGVWFYYANLTASVNLQKGENVLVLHGDAEGKVLLQVDYLLIY